MCLAIPMRIREIRGNRAVAEAYGVEKEVDITMVPDLRPDDRVIIHAGFVIEKLDPDAAREIEATWDEYIKAMDGDKRKTLKEGADGEAQGGPSARERFSK
ncbi:MAG TPA: HypC/HybG/HupF family hydrogenase formation chaperone [Spirochaetes bacterium]|nr:HypC/HybG/HupF family hydrogenase formation chaperone [Spirochaetota bacterium]